MERAATHAPIASESEETAAAVTIALRRSARAPNRTSRPSESSHGSSFRSRLCSRQRIGLPNRRATCRAASSRGTPFETRASMRDSRWNCSSASRSRSTRPGRITLASRDHNDIEGPPVKVNVPECRSAGVRRCHSANVRRCQGATVRKCQSALLHSCTVHPGTLAPWHRKHRGTEAPRHLGPPEGALRLLQDSAHR